MELQDITNQLSTLIHKKDADLLFEIEKNLYQLYQELNETMDEVSSDGFRPIKDACLRFIKEHEGEAELDGSVDDEFTQLHMFIKSPFIELHIEKIYPWSYGDIDGHSTGTSIPVDKTQIEIELFGDTSLHSNAERIVCDAVDTIMTDVEVNHDAKNKNIIGLVPDEGFYDTLCNMIEVLNALDLGIWSGK